MAADEEVTETNQTHKGLRWLDVGIILAVAPIVVASLRVVIFTGGDPVLTQGLGKVVVSGVWLGVMGAWSLWILG